jgi:hypothetical protein
MEKQKDLLVSEEKIFNPIGLLNEFCQKTKTTPPLYVTKNREGPDHSPIFNIECIFKNLSFHGSGLTIKEAKEKTALNVIEYLNSQGILKKDIKPSFRIVEVSPHSDSQAGIECIWDGKCSDMKITFRRKIGSSQQFKTFIFSKINEFEHDSLEVSTKLEN